MELKLNQKDANPATAAALGAALAARRLRLTLTRREVAERTRLKERAVGNIEAGRRRPTAEELSVLARCLQVKQDRLLEEADLVETFRRLPGNSHLEAAKEILSWTGDLYGLLMETFRARALPRAKPCAREAGWERLLAEDSWERLKPLSPEARRNSIGGDRLLANPLFMRWGLAERLCAECEAHLAEDPAEALGLAELALRVAGMVAGDPAWRSHLKGYAWAFIAKAKQAAGDRAGAEQAVSTGRDLWNPSSIEERDFLEWPGMPGLSVGA
jgi:transcriptional regulator with XRE-family HTH domain